MAKPQKRKARPSWFQRQIERNGPDFLVRKTPLDIQREYLNIVRDIVRGNITPKDYQYLFDNKVLPNVIVAIFNRCNELRASRIIMIFTMSVPNSSEILERMYYLTPKEFQNLFNTTNDEFNAFNSLLYELNILDSFVKDPNPKTEEDYERVYQSAQYRLSIFKNVLEKTSH